MGRAIQVQYLRIISSYSAPDHLPVCKELQEREIVRVHVYVYVMLFRGNTNSCGNICVPVFHFPVVMTVMLAMF